MMEIVPASLEYRDLNSVQGVCECAGVTHRDHTVALSPDDGDGWYRANLVCPLREATALSAPVDDVANGPSEGASRAGTRVEGAELREIFGRENAAEDKPRTQAEEGLSEALHDDGD